MQIINETLSSDNMYKGPYQRSHKLLLISIEISGSHNFMSYQKFHASVISFPPSDDKKIFRVDMVFQKYEKS